MADLWLDIETYSSVNLKKSNVYRYVEAHDFEILMCAWTVDGEEYHIEIGEDDIRKIPGLEDPDVIKVAHNAPFERICLSRITDRELAAEEFRDTRAMAAAAGYPQSLEFCAKALKVAPKDSAGTALINWFCRPFKGKRRMPEDHLEKWQKFKDYCIQDVVVLYAIDQLLPELSEMEQRILLADQRINDRGVAVDLNLATAAREAAAINKMIDELEFINLTGVKKPGSIPQMLRWLADAGSPLPNLRAESVAAALQGSVTGPVRRALELRQELALTSSNKYEAALRSTCADGRLRGEFFYHGAHTGRWAGRGVQLHNLAKLGFTDVDDEYDIVAEKMAILDLMLGNGADPVTLKKLVRPMFLVRGAVVDLSAIEARILAWLAGEKWLLDAFKEGRDPYVETAGRMGPVFTRWDGKIAVLALGYQGAVQSLRNLGMEGSVAKLVKFTRSYRKTIPKTVNFWYKFDKVFVTGGDVGRINVERDKKTRIVHLPSGRDLIYHDVRRYEIDDKMVTSFANPKGGRMTTYGGKLTENVTQGTARDILGEGLVRLEEAGHRVVLHVHDEAAVENGDVDEVAKIMCEQPKWAKGLPLAAAGFTTDRYRKE